MDRTDLFHAHIGGIDTLARSLLVAADMVEQGTPRRDARGALRGLGDASSGGRSWPARRSLEALAGRVAAGEIDPRPVSGRQELYENVVNRHIWAAGPAERDRRER